MNEIIVSGAQRFDRVAHAEIHGSAGMPRTTTQAGSTPTDIVAMVELAADTRHCVIHDVHNVFWGADASGGGTPRIYGTMYDVRVYNIGWKTLAAGDRTSEAGGHGQAIYTQNYGADGQKVIDTCMFAAGFSWMKIYGTNSELINLPSNEIRIDHPLNKLSNYRIRNTVFVGKSFLIGGVSVGAHDIEIDDCAFLDSGLLMGYAGGNGDGSVRNCLLTRGLQVAGGRVNFTVWDAVKGLGNPFGAISWRELTVTGNTIIGDGQWCANVVNPSKGWAWDNNTYYSNDPKPFVVNDERLTFAEWQAATGFDAGSTYHEGLPSAPMVREYAVEGLGKKVSNVAVYNPTHWIEVALPIGWAEALITNVLNPDDHQEENIIDMNGVSALPEGWTGGRVPPLAREIMPTHGVFRFEEIETEEGGDDAVAKIASLEALLASKEALVKSMEIMVEARDSEIVEQMAALASKSAAISALDKIIIGNNALVERLGEQAQQHLLEAAAQQKIIDAARALWEASGAFGAIMGVKNNVQTNAQP